MYLLNFLNFTQLLFYFSFEPICIFNFPEKIKKRNWALALYCFGLKRPTAHSRTRPSRALTRAQAATWAWAGKVASRPRPPGPKGGPFNLGRPS